MSNQCFQLKKFHSTYSTVCLHSAGVGSPFHTCSGGGIIWPIRSQPNLSSGWSMRSVYWSTMCLHQAAPPHMAEMCVPISATDNWCHLRSATHGDLAVPRVRLARYGRSFCVGSTAVKLTTTDCSRCIIDIDSVLHTIEDFGFPEPTGLIIAPLWQFQL